MKENRKITTQQSQRNTEYKKKKKARDLFTGFGNCLRPRGFTEVRSDPLWTKFYTLNLSSSLYNFFLSVSLGLSLFLGDFLPFSFLSVLSGFVLLSCSLFFVDLFLVMSLGCGLINEVEEDLLAVGWVWVEDGWDDAMWQVGWVWVEDDWDDAMWQVRFKEDDTVLLCGCVFYI